MSNKAIHSNISDVFNSRFKYALLKGNATSELEKFPRNIIDTVITFPALLGAKRVFRIGRP